MVFVRFQYRLLGMRTTCALTLAALFLCSTTTVARPAEGNEPVWQATRSSKQWDYHLSTSKQQTLDLTLKLAPQGKPLQFLLTRRHQDVGTPLNLLKVTIARDADGRILSTTAATWSDGKWSKSASTRLTYWPEQRNQIAITRAGEDGIAPRSWRDQRLPCRIAFEANSLRFYLQGKIIGQTSVDNQAGDIAVQLLADAGDTIATIATHPLVDTESWRYHTVDLSAAVNTAVQSPITPDARGTIPYELANQGYSLLDLKHADWIDGKRNPSSYYERYDSGQYFLGDERMPMIQIPVADYTAAYVLASADANPNTSNTLTLRAGRYNSGYRGQAVRYDFPAPIPRNGHDDTPMRSVRVDMSKAFAQDILDDVMDVEITKEIRLARRTPDANRFRWRPQGPPSGARIAAITFERSPLQMRVTSKQNGHLFVESQTPTFDVTLTNISPDAQPFTLNATGTYVNGETINVRRSGSVDAGQSKHVAVAVPATIRGYYDIVIELLDASGNRLLERQSSFAVLPDVKRPYHNESPVGVWDFCGGHLTADDPDFTGPVYQKLGIRYGMFHYPHEKRQQYGVVKGNEYSVRSSGKVEELIPKYEALRGQHPDLLKNLLIFHEDSISAGHVTRVPDLFTDREPYKLNEEERKRWDAMYELAVESAKRMRAHDPTVTINIGNGPIPLREEFLRRGFPRELFDNAGNEAGVFGRAPEVQPPDIVANNASVWMDRQLLDHYGYPEKGIAQCYEIDYPSTNPGNLSLETQAAYFARHLLHGMSWGMPQLRVGSITDMANSYYFSNWGASGIMHKWPEVNPKPAAVALGTLTWMLDGATFDHKLDMGSDSLYALAFDRKDGKRVIALWTIHGQRPVTFTFNHTANVAYINGQAVETSLPLTDNKATITVTGEPAYLRIDRDVTIRSVEPGTPVYASTPRGTTAVVSPMNALDSWTVSDQRSPELEAYNPMEPRRKGNFKFQHLPTFEGRDNVIKVTPQSIEGGKATMPMYAELIANKPIPLDGQPSELGIWVNGNSGWGRIIFRFEDAKGQRWSSIGAPGKSGNRWLADWLPPEMLDSYNPDQHADWNTNDLFGLSRINFDGWRYLGIPLPGQYPGGIYPWPANSQWRFDGDGIVSYPIQLTGVVVQLPEKTLLVQDFQPARRASIYLSEIIVSQDESNRVKKSIAEYDPSAQVNGM